TVLPVLITSFLAGGPFMVQLNLLVAALLFHGAVFAFNDYFDHMQGVDRMSDRRGSRLIQTGQFRAVDVLKIAWLYWGMALLAGLPIVWQRPGVLAFLICGLGLATLGSTYSRFGFKAIFLSDLMVFLCLGPLLTASVSYALAGWIPIHTLVIGAAFGLTAVLY